MPSLSESINLRSETNDWLVSGLDGLMFCLVPPASCFLFSASAGTPSKRPARGSNRFTLHPRAASEMMRMLAVVVERFEGARICKGTSIAAYYDAVSSSICTRMLSRIGQANHSYITAWYAALECGFPQSSSSQSPQVFGCAQKF